jgi:hypothetical protein
LDDESSVWREVDSNELKQLDDLVLAKVLDYVKGGDQVEALTRLQEVFSKVRLRYLKSCLPSEANRLPA